MNVKSSLSVSSPDLLLLSYLVEPVLTSKLSMPKTTTLPPGVQSVFVQNSLKDGCSKAAEYVYSVERGSTPPSSESNRHQQN